MIGMVKGMMRETKTVAGLPSPIASFRSNASGVKLDSLKVLVEAQQDLHGYDYPWAGGAGRNLFNMGSKVSATHAGMTITSDDDYLIVNGTKYGNAYFVPSTLGFTLPSGTYHAKAFTSGTASSQPSIYVMSGSDVLTTDIRMSEFTFTLSEETTLTIRFAFWTDNATYNNYKIGIVISKTSGIDKFYPYENICPITGWSGAVVSRVGSRNILDPHATKFGNYTISPDGSHNEATDRLATHYLRCKGNTSYKAISDKKITSYTYAFLDIAFYDENLNYISRSYTNNTNNSFTFTTPANAKFLVYSEQFSGLSNITPAVFETYDRCLVEGDIDSYEPFVGNTYTIAFGDTYYGGELDVTNGVLRVLYEKYKLPSTGWVFSSNRYQKSDVLPVGEYYSDKNVMCDTYPKITLAQAGQGAKGVVMGYNSHYIYFYITEDFPTLSDWTTYLTNNDVYINRPLATPIEIQLTPTQIGQLLGDNNVFADCGEISELKYQNRIITKLFSKG